MVFGQELLELQFDGRDEMASILRSPRKSGHRLQQEGYTMKRNPCGERWSFTHQGAIFRSRLVFVDERSFGGVELAMNAAIEARGVDCARKRLKSGNVVTLPKHQG